MICKMRRLMYTFSPSIISGTKLVIAMVGITYVDPMDNVVLNNFNLLIPQGQIVSLVGDVKEVGDVVIAILSGLCVNYKGCVTQFGWPVDPQMLSRNVSICPVDFFLLGSSSIQTNVKLFLSARRVTGEITSFDICSWIESTGTHSN